MTKKEYILAVIDSVPDWELGWGIKAMVQNDQLDDKAINALVIIFKKTINNFFEGIKQEEKLENFNRKKEEQAEQDKENLKQLDNMLNNI